MNYSSHTRIKFLSEHGFPQSKFEAAQIGPVVFSEGFHFFKEMMPNEQVYITVELQGASENYMFFQFHHHFYKQDGSHAAFAELYGGWMSLTKRRLVVPPETLVHTLDQMPRTNEFKILTKEDLKKVRMQPQSTLFVP